MRCLLRGFYGPLGQIHGATAGVLRLHEDQPATLAYPLQLPDHPERSGVEVYIGQRISARYVAGGTLEAAEVGGLDPQGCAATSDLLGESTEGRADAAATLRMYKRVLDELGEDLDSGVSVKLTAPG